jgi:hypothetical protein
VLVIDEYLWQHRFSKVEIGSLCSKQGFSVEAKKHMYFSKENNLC